MPDREKVLKALEHHKETAVCNGCPYEKDADTQGGYCPVYDDVITLLKEQEPVEPVEVQDVHYPIRDPHRTIGWKCGNCGEDINSAMNYCPECGREQNWNGY